MCIDSFNFFTLQSNANGLYVAVEHAAAGRYLNMLVARTRPENLGTWERFRMEDFGDVVAFKSDRGEYVSAEFAYGGDEEGMLRARDKGTTRGPWESFEYSWA